MMSTDTLQHKDEESMKEVKSGPSLTAQESGGAMRTSLPVPREVRNQIYNYLLHSDYALDDPKNGNRHRYHFHIGILGVNHTTYQEARPVLYRSNTFVLLKHLDTHFELAYNEAGIGVPFVSTHHLDAFDEHRLSVEFTERKRDDEKGEHCTHEHCTYEQCTYEPKLQTRLMLAGDLPYLCRLFKALAFCYQGKYTFIQSARDERPFRAVNRVSTGPRRDLKLEMCTGSFGTPSIDEQKTVLEPFTAIHGTAFNVSITGNVCTMLANKIIHDMSQSVVWVYAIGWDFLKMARLIKSEADMAFRAGNLAIAERKCLTILSLSNWLQKIVPDDDNVTYTSGNRRDWRESLVRLCFDAEYMLCIVTMRQGNFLQAKFYITSMIDKGVLGGPPYDTMRSRVSHVFAIFLLELGDYDSLLWVVEHEASKNPLDSRFGADIDILIASLEYEV